MKQTTKNITLSAMFLALGMVLPFLTGQIPQIGSIPFENTAVFPKCGVRHFLNLHDSLLHSICARAHSIFIITSDLYLSTAFR